MSRQKVFQNFYINRLNLLKVRPIRSIVNTYMKTTTKTLSHIITLVALLGAAASAQDAPKKITKLEAMDAIAAKQQPEYPPVARQLKIQGTVEFLVLVTENGSVKKVDIVSGNPVLTGPSAMTVKGWKFKPFQEGGKPIQVLAPVSLDFKL